MYLREGSNNSVDDMNSADRISYSDQVIYDSKSCETKSLLGSSDELSPTPEPEPRTEPESGLWCWLVLLSSFLTLSVLDGVNYSFGVMMDPLMDELGGGRSGMAMAGSLQTGVYAVSGLLAAKLTTK